MMNCYNGDAYLKEAIDSVYSQSFKDWRIVFIDNCSTDRSAEIAKSYGSKLEYYKTEKNIPFGAARNYGLQRCHGAYVSFLDVDDVYYDNTLETLVNEIEDTDYLLVYGGHTNIDSSGSVIGSYTPSIKKGCIFKELLLQFDIPTATSILNLSRFQKSRLNYDSNILVSAEYCLFLQLSVKNKFKSIGGEVAKYRIHGASLTSKNLPYLYDDRIYTLDKIIYENTDINNRYLFEFKEAYARADYYKVRFLLSLNKKEEARALLRKHAFQDVKYFSLYLILFFPKLSIIILDPEQ